MGKVIRCSCSITQAKERERRAVCLPPPRAKESLRPDIATLTILSGRAIFEEL